MAANNLVAMFRLIKLDHLLDLPLVQGIAPGRLLP